MFRTELFFTSKCSFSSGVGYVMRPILLIMWTAFQSFILRDNNNNNNKKKKKRKFISSIKITSFYESNT